jgi:beta-galactosidase beta subunit
MIINNISYSTQKSLKSKVKLVISELKSTNTNHIKPGTEFFCFWNDLFKRHPTKSHFIPTSFTFEKPYHMYFNVDNYRDSFSYNDCITGKSKNKTYDFLACLRSSIEPQIKNFRKNQSSYKCVSCNTNDDNIKYEVDHVKPFKQIYNEFMKTIEEIDPNDFKMIYDSKKHRLMFDLSDDYTKSLHDLWIDFHNENADLQILCISCHINKTKNETA